MNAENFGNVCLAVLTFSGMIRLVAWFARKTWPFSTIKHIRVFDVNTLIHEDSAMLRLMLKNDWWRPVEVLAIGVKFEGYDYRPFPPMSLQCFSCPEPGGTVYITGDFTLPAFPAEGGRLTITSVTVRELGYLPIKGEINEYTIRIPAKVQQAPNAQK